MRRIIVSCVVLAIVSFAAVQQASALGWRRAHRAYQRVVVTPVAKATATESPAKTPVKVDEKVALSQVLDAMQGVLAREYDRLEREIEWYEEDQSSASYGSD